MSVSLEKIWLENKCESSARLITKEAGDILTFFFFFFSEKIKLHISCKSSA